MITILSPFVRDYALRLPYSVRFAIIAI